MGAAVRTFGQEEPQEARESDHSYTGVELRGWVAQILVYIWRERKERVIIIYARWCGRFYPKHLDNTLVPPLLLWLGGALL